MKTKRVVRLSCLLVLLFVMMIPSKSEAVENETNIGITFEKAIKKEEVEVKPPIIDDGSNKPPIRMLPQTGEMLASLIVILIGFSLFIFSIGILAIRELYQKTSWEVN
ncbi:hypothetical protein ACQUEF_10290 [Vagococcus fluvialis]|jgi:hypothetical protein|uniref:hypothetical protein n=1 Tax=Vagococcus fluvialis TaxID=2738 RepID=UPI0028172C16|nr:hypothetical protein [Vagococcus sp.]